MIDTTYLQRCIATLSQAYSLLLSAERESIMYDMYRSACVKEFEIILEQIGKLLRKVLKSYFHSAKEVDRLQFKDIFRHAVVHSIISDEECERWLVYRDNRNNTAHDYGEDFAEQTLQLLAEFIADATRMVTHIEQNNASQRER